MTMDRRAKIAERMIGACVSAVSVAADAIHKNAINGHRKCRRGLQLCQKEIDMKRALEALGAVPQMVLDRKATVGVCGPLDVEIPGLERIGVGSVEFIPVAAPDHPLARAARNAPGAARDHIQLVLADRSPLADGKQRGVIGTQTWRLADLGSKYMLLREGIGWGYMPEPFVHEDIDEGRLARLDVPEYKDGFLRLHAIYRTGTPPGPAASWLIDRFETQAKVMAKFGDEHAALVNLQSRRKKSVAVK
jgi:DNA-binding transcriptional LysR family regulator